MAIQANWNYTKVSGTGLLYTGTSIDFSNQIHALDFCGEFNFFDLEKKDYKPFSKTYSPFIYAGVGAMLYNYEGKQDFMFSYPFGVGLKNAWTPFEFKHHVVAQIIAYRPKWKV